MGRPGGYFWCTDSIKLLFFFIFFSIYFYKLDDNYNIVVVLKTWNASQIFMSSLCRGHANLLCIVPILVYVLPRRALNKTFGLKLLIFLFKRVGGPERTDFHLMEKPGPKGFDPGKN